MENNVKVEEIKMNAIEKMLIGEMEMKDFVQLINNDKSLQTYIRELIPEEMKNNPDHAIWKNYCYEAMKNNDFDILKVIATYPKRNNVIRDSVNVFGIFEAIYCFLHPEIKCTTKYYDEHSLYLSAIGDSFEGEEVTEYIERIVKKNINITPKSKRLKETKEQIKQLFHVTDNKRPRWIQNAEWPAGKNSPMKYLYRKSISDGSEYYFEDVDTGAVRKIVQFY